MPDDILRLNLVDRVNNLPEQYLPALERFLANLTDTPPTIQSATAEQHPATVAVDWPHAPLHRVLPSGTYIVTAGTYLKTPYFDSTKKLDFLHDALLSLAKQLAWQIEAWAVFSNHYHFVGHAPNGASSLRLFIKRLHHCTAKWVNEHDKMPARKVWYNYWETALTYEKSYFARLNYVYQNAVRHGLVPVANRYRWCSAAWFERTATSAQVKTIYRFKTDQLKVIDEFEPRLPTE